MSAIHELAVLHRGPDQDLAMALTDTLRGEFGIAAYCYTDDVPGLSSAPADVRQAQVLDKFRHVLFLIQGEPGPEQGAWFGFEQNAVYKQVVGRLVAKPGETSILAAVASIRHEQVLRSSMTAGLSDAQLADRNIIEKVVSPDCLVPFTPTANSLRPRALAEAIAGRLDPTWHMRPRVIVAALTRTGAEALGDKGPPAACYGSSPSHFSPPLSACSDGSCWFAPGNTRNGRTLAELLCDWSRQWDRPIPHFIGDWLFAPTSDPAWSEKREVASKLLTRDGPNVAPVRLVVDSASLVSEDLFHEVNRVTGTYVLTSLRPDPIGILLSSGIPTETEMQAMWRRTCSHQRLTLLELFQRHSADVTIIGAALPGLRDWFHRSTRPPPQIVNLPGTRPPKVARHRR